MEESFAFNKNNKVHKIKLAILILAHRNLKQLKRLVSTLYHDDVDVFIHLDKKWELETKQIEELEQLNKGNVFISDNRISGKLFDWSLIEAEMEAIRKAKLTEHIKNVNYQYFCY